MRPKHGYVDLSWKVADGVSRYVSVVHFEDIIA